MMDTFVLLLILTVLTGHVASRATPAPDQAGRAPNGRPVIPPGQDCSAPIDVCFILDSSGSVKLSGWQSTLDFVNRLVDGINNFKSGSQYGIVVFFDYPDYPITLMEWMDPDVLRGRIKDLEFRDGYTNTAEGLEVTATDCFSTKSDRANSSNVAIFISDGVPTLNINELPEAIDLLHNKTDLVISLGVGDEITIETLQAVSWRGVSYKGPVQEGRDYYRAANFDILPELVDRIVAATCFLAPPPTVTPLPTVTPAPTVTPLPTVTALPTVTPMPTVTTTSSDTPISTDAPTPIGPIPTLPPIDLCPADLDICLLLDRSGSQELTWTTVQTTAINFIRQIKDLNPHVGVVAFASGINVRLEVNLGSNDFDFLIGNISNIKQVNDYTDIPFALRLTSRLCFNSEGDRANVSNVAIIISDGMITHNEMDLQKAVAVLQESAHQVIAIGIGNMKNISIRTLEMIADVPDAKPSRPSHQVLINPQANELNALITDMTTFACQPSVPRTPKPTRIPMPGTPFPPTPQPPTPTPRTPIQGTPFPPTPKPPTPSPRPPRTPMPGTPFPPTPRPTPPTEPPTPGTCNVMVDLCFILDSSGSVNATGWGEILNFAEGVTSGFLDSEAQVGVVSFADHPFAFIPLMAPYMAIEEILTIPFLDGFTNAAEALEYTADQCFNRVGDRDDAINVAVFLSDGLPNVRNTPEDLTKATGILHEAAQLVFSVGILLPGLEENDATEILLRNIATNYQTGRQSGPDLYFATTSFPALRGIVDTVINNVCNDVQGFGGQK